MNRNVIATVFVIATVSACGGDDSDSATIPTSAPVTGSSENETNPSSTTVGSESTEDANNPDLPSGQPTGTPAPAAEDQPETNGLETVDILNGASEPVLVRVTPDRPSSDYPSAGGLDSNSPEFESLRTTPTDNSSLNECLPLLQAMARDRGESNRQEFHRTPPGRYAVGDARWYDTQGYVILYASGAPDGVCQTIDYRYIPVSNTDQTNATEPETGESEAEDNPPQEDTVTETVVRGVRFSLVDYFMTSYGAPAVKMRVTNDRNTGDIYNVACDVHALSGTTIVDSAFVYFANGGTIQVSESAEEDGIFFDLNSFDDFETTRQECDFLLAR